MPEPQPIFSPANLYLGTYLYKSYHFILIEKMVKYFKGTFILYDYS